jgi:hypothetical protein
MPHAIIRGANGRRHQVDFGDAAVRVEIYAGEETVEIFIEGISKRSQQSVGGSPFSTFLVTYLAKLPPQPRDGLRTSVPHPRRDERFRNPRPGGLRFV